MLEEALSCLQEATDTSRLLADNHCSVQGRDFPTAVLHCWASVHTDPDPKLSLKPIAFFPVTAQGFGCGPLQPGAQAAAKILACVLRAMGIDDHSYSFWPYNQCSIFWYSLPLPNREHLFCSIPDQVSWEILDFISVFLTEMFSLGCLDINTSISKGSWRR